MDLTLLWIFLGLLLSCVDAVKGIKMRSMMIYVILDFPRRCKKSRPWSRSVSSIFFIFIFSSFWRVIIGVLSCAEWDAHFSLHTHPKNNIKFLPYVFVILTILTACWLMEDKNQRDEENRWRIYEWSNITFGGGEKWEVNLRKRAIKFRKRFQISMLLIMSWLFSLVQK